MLTAALNVARLAAAAVAIVAMTYQFTKTADGSGARSGNFFSFFTIQSNILAVALLGLVAITPRAARTPLFDAVRGAVTLYLAITGVVFALLLGGLQEELQTTIPWVDFVVHKLIPLVIVADWLVDRQRHRLPLWVAGAWLAYPAAWFAYTLVRGEIEGWYPYPFVDVSRLGYDGVALRAVGLLAGFALAAFALLWLGNRRARSA